VLAHQRATAEPITSDEGLPVVVVDGGAAVSAEAIVQVERALAPAR
jgi:hypothetical protein